MRGVEHPVAGSPYQGYAYSYPHKTAWRALDPPLALSDLWRDEPQGALFLYVHVPFCEGRCGYCNLFSVSSTDRALHARWLDALAREAVAVRAALGQPSFARLAIGGGTPTLLDDVDALFDLLESTFGVDGRRVPASCETSPGTARRPILERLRERGVDRLSIGIQSFRDDELRALGRAQPASEARAALERIRAVGFPTLNVDLIYGIPGQTAATWRASLQDAVEFASEELYLYPLYVRPGTPLGRRRVAPGPDARLDLYRVGRDFLCEHGYTQVSMRMFRRDRPVALSPEWEGSARDQDLREGPRGGDRVPHRGGAALPAYAPPSGSSLGCGLAQGPVYRCQESGMVGLGCGARSYTSRVHYATPHATDPREVRAILEARLRSSPAHLGLARHGFILDGDEARRRYVIKSLLQVEGLDEAAYTAWCGSSAFDDLPCLADLLDLNLATRSAFRLRLTPAGLERSDSIGPWLYSTRVKALMVSGGPS